VKLDLEREKAEENRSGGAELGPDIYLAMRAMISRITRRTVRLSSFSILLGRFR